ncbi:MAG TPA: glycosyltransferase family 1 protein [Candidatus Magasanikbacteria bacterium]|nr:glycosyltransferase family 1 protein [Candidatus Magasanikbacteria bacterium]
MRIGLDARVLQTGPATGVQEFTRFLYQSLLALDSGHEWILYFNTHRGIDKGVLESLPTKNVVIRSTPSKMVGLTSIFGVGKTIDEFCAERGMKLDAFFSPNINFTRISSGMPFFLTIHDLSFVHYPEYFNWWRRVWHQLVNPAGLARQARVIFPPSESTTRDLVETFGIEKSKIEVLSPVVDPRFVEFARLEKSERDTVVSTTRKKYNLPEKYYLFVSAIEPRKNLSGILEAYAVIKKQSPNCPVLVVVGPRGWKCEKILRQMTIMRGVKYIGYVDVEDRPALYACAKVLLYPSYYEGFGFPVLEAGAVGTPVVASSRAALCEFDWGGVYYVNPRNVLDITRGIREAEESGTAPMGSIRTWDDVAREFISIIEKNVL